MVCGEDTIEFSKTIDGYLSKWVKIVGFKPGTKKCRCLCQNKLLGARCRRRQNRATDREKEWTPGFPVPNIKTPSTIFPGPDGIRCWIYAKFRRGVPMIIPVVGEGLIILVDRKVEMVSRVLKTSASKPTEQLIVAVPPRNIGIGAVSYLLSGVAGYPSLLLTSAERKYSTKKQHAWRQCMHLRNEGYIWLKPGLH